MSYIPYYFTPYLFNLFRGCYGYWSIVFSVSLRQSWPSIMEIWCVSHSHIHFSVVKIWKWRRNYWWTGNYKAIHPQVCLTSITISSIEYIELVIKLLEKTFEIKVSSIEFFAFYHTLFTFLPACQKWEDLTL